MHDQVAAVLFASEVRREAVIYYFDDVAVFELFEFPGARQEGFFGFVRGERREQQLDNEIFLALLVPGKVKPAGGTLCEQLGDGIWADLLEFSAAHAVLPVI